MKKATVDGIGMHPVPVLLKLMLMSMNGLGILDDDTAYSLSQQASNVDGTEYTLQRWLVIDPAKFQNTPYYNTYVNANNRTNALGTFTKMAPRIPIKDYTVSSAETAWIKFNLFGTDVIINVNPAYMKVDLDLQCPADDASANQDVTDLKKALNDTSVSLTTTAKLLQQASVLSKAGNFDQATNDWLKQVGQDYINDVQTLRDQGGYVMMMPSDFSTTVNGLGFFGLDDACIIVLFWAVSAVIAAVSITYIISNLLKLKSSNEVKQSIINAKMKLVSDRAANKISQEDFDKTTKSLDDNYNAEEETTRQIIDSSPGIFDTLKKYAVPAALIVGGLIIIPPLLKK